MIIGLPGYALEETPTTIVPLPVSWDPLSNPYLTTRNQIKLQTGRGVAFEYELFTQISPIFIFTMSASQLTTFKTMYDAVVGNPFYFMPDIDNSPVDGLHVRIKDPVGFVVEPIGVFLDSGLPEQFFRYELKLIGEITAASVED